MGRLATVAKFVKREFRKIRTLARIAVLAIIGISVTLGAPIANGLGSAKPTLIEEKFDLPADQRVVAQELRWSHLVGQIGGAVKVYSGV